MKLSVMLMSFSRDIRSGRTTMEDMIAYCGELGLDGVEIANREIASMSDDQVRDLLGRHGLELACYIVVTDFVCQDQETLSQAIDKTNQEIYRAARLGCKTVMIVPGDPKPEISHEKGRQMIAVGLQACALHGQEHGVTVTNENYGMAVEFRGRIGHMQEFLENAPACRLTYDGGNFLLGGEDPLEALDILYDDVRHVHLKDWVVVDQQEGGRFPVPDQPGRFYKSAIVSEGVMPTAATVAALKERGYQGFLSIEHGGGIPGKEGLTKAFHSLKRWLDE
ncbi:MAG: sugar phosphate isomerase/epimerase family protein [Limnochordia bacterium]